MSGMHKEIDVPPHRIIINAEREYRPRDPDPNGGYYARAVISRRDGAPVFEKFLMYQLAQGEVFVDLQDTLADAERRARQVIAEGFPTGRLSSHDFGDS
jgi:hypothetical protein